MTGFFDRLDRLLEAYDGAMKRIGLKRDHDVTPERIEVAGTAIEKGTTLYDVTRDVVLEARHLGENDRGDVVVLFRFRQDRYPARWLEFTRRALRVRLQNGDLATDKQRIDQLINGSSLTKL